MRGIGGRQERWTGSLGMVGRRRLGSHGSWPYRPIWLIKGARPEPCNRKRRRGSRAISGLAPGQQSFGPPQSAALPVLQDGTRGRLPVLYGMDGGLVIFCSGKKWLVSRWTVPGWTRDIVGHGQRVAGLPMLVLPMLVTIGVDTSIQSARRGLAGQTHAPTSARVEPGPDRRQGQRRRLNRPIRLS
jgi:hypothetical protein